MDGGYRACLVLFYSPNCPHCRGLHEEGVGVLDRLAEDEDFQKERICTHKVDVTGGASSSPLADAPVLVQGNRVSPVQSVPTLILWSFPSEEDALSVEGGTDTYKLEGDRGFDNVKDLTLRLLLEE